MKRMTPSMPDSLPATAVVSADCIALPESSFSLTECFFGLQPRQKRSDNAINHLSIAVVSFHNAPCITVWQYTLGILRKNTDIKKWLEAFEIWLHL